MVLSEDQFLYLETTGWKTRMRHRIEIWFVEREGKYYIMSEGRERAHWVRNIMHDSKISFNVGGEAFAGTGRVVEIKDPAAAEVKKLMKGKYGWDEGLIVELAPAAGHARNRVRSGVRQGFGDGD
ncbi:MAG TPA: nitroreductase/quinone reductase family protein [Nitrososphaera sp.]|nr:nitroreductase/quinone reductase family protein [Nitrososphaera sp.]